jgi:hypothetical protein
LIERGLDRRRRAGQAVETVAHLLEQLLPGERGIRVGQATHAHHAEEDDDQR